MGMLYTASMSIISGPLFDWQLAPSLKPQPRQSPFCTDLGVMRGLCLASMSMVSWPRHPLQPLFALHRPFPTHLGVMRGLCFASTSMISCTLSLRVVKMMTRLRGAPPAPASRVERARKCSSTT